MIYLNNYVVDRIIMRESMSVVIELISTQREKKNHFEIKCYNFFDRANFVHFPPIRKIPSVYTIVFTCRILSPNANNSIYRVVNSESRDRCRFPCQSE